MLNFCVCVCVCVFGGVGTEEKKTQNGFVFIVVVAFFEPFESLGQKKKGKVRRGLR